MYLHPTVQAADALVRPGLLGPTPMPSARLAEVAGRFAAAADLWRPIMHHDPVESWYTRLLATASVEVWLLGWSPGQHVRAHDHGGASGAFAVVDGVLVEDCLDPTIWTTGRRTTFRAGSTTAFGPDHVHVLGNRTSATAISVHAWSPPGRPLSPAGSHRSGSWPPSASTCCPGRCP